MNERSPITSARIASTFGILRRLIAYDLDKLARLAIPAEALARPTPVRASYVHFSHNQFEFDHHLQGKDGEPVYLFLSHNGWGEANDIVAWSPSSGRLATWLGRAWALGEETIYRPRLSNHGALPVWRSAADWLRARREGICLLRPKAAAHYLCDAGPLLAEDTTHGEELRRLLTRPAPRILVPSSKLRKVA